MQIFQPFIERFEPRCLTKGGTKAESKRNPKREMERGRGRRLKKKNAFSPDASRNRRRTPCSHNHRRDIGIKFLSERGREALLAIKSVASVDRSGDAIRSLQLRPSRSRSNVPGCIAVSIPARPHERGFVGIGEYVHIARTRSSAHCGPAIAAGESSHVRPRSAPDSDFFGTYGTVPFDVRPQPRSRT